MCFGDFSIEYHEWCFEDDMVTSHKQSWGLFLCGLLALHHRELAVPVFTYTLQASEPFWLFVLAVTNACNPNLGNWFLCQLGLEFRAGEQLTRLCKIYSWQAKTEQSNKESVKKILEALSCLECDLGRWTRKRYLYAPGRAQSVVQSSWRSSLAPSEPETLLWRGWSSFSPWQRRWSGKPLRWCLLDSRPDRLEQRELERDFWERTCWSHELLEYEQRMFEQSPDLHLLD